MSPSEGINWEQLSDLVGDVADAEQRAMLLDMWSDVKNALPQEWAKLGAVADAAALRRDLHRVRGYLATWGMDGVAAGLLEIEKAADPVAAWRDRGRGVIEAQRACVAEVEKRYPVLSAES